MTPESKRISIAEACGWKMTPISRAFDVHPKFRHVDHTLDQEFTINELPDYLGDLNAMAEAEKVLSPDQGWEYATHLAVMGNGWSATAAQRAEAFLRTLNLWKD